MIQRKWIGKRGEVQAAVDPPTLLDYAGHSGLSLVLQWFVTIRDRGKINVNQTYLAAEGSPA